MELLEKIPLKVTDLKQYAYCQRIVFYEYVMPVSKKTTFKMELGKEIEFEMDVLEKRRTLKKYGFDKGNKIFHKWIFSKHLNLSGMLDMLIQTEDAYYPVDFKNSTGKPQKNHIYQLTGYALILDELHNISVTQGFIYLIPIKSIVKIEITDSLKKDVLLAIDQIRKMVSQEIMPEPTSIRNICLECEYKNYCGDVF